jgi:transcriptional regulator with XRE-family HTH domain
LQFNEYLKSCREESKLTQEELVHDLYQYNTDDFGGLDATTLSKWERGKTKPKIAKQVNIVKYFQEKTNSALPCLDKYSVQETEALICKAGMHNLLGKSEELILNFPSAMVGPDDLKVYQVRNSDMIDKAISVHMRLDKTYSHNTNVSAEQVKEWALYPSNSLYLCEYLNQLFGLLFTLRLKPEVFRKIMSHEMKEGDLTLDDFASFDEMGSNYIFSFFALNEQAATMLFIRYYAHLIANQKVIEEVGVATAMDDAKNIIESLSLKYHASTMLKEDMELQSYRETLTNFLASEKVIEMLLTKQDCPEEV